MNTTQQNTLHTREGILSLISDEENARVSRAEGELRLVEADEYVDLEHLGRGVLQVHSDTRITPGHVIPSSAVSDATWARIVHHLRIRHPQ